MDIKIDKEFADLCRKLTAEEENLLETQLCDEGCRDALVLWAGHGILLDGHNRKRLCERNGLAYNTVEVVLGNREQAIEWIITNQLGKRNLSEEEKAFLRGKRYRNEKKKVSNESGRNQHSEVDGHGDHQPTAEKLADEYGVSAVTIRRDARFADGLDVIAKTSPDLKDEILSGKSTVSRASVMKVGALPEDEQEEAVAMLLAPEASKEHRQEADSVPIVSLSKGEEESRKIIDEFTARIELVTDGGVYTLETIREAFSNCSTNTAIEFVRMCEVAPHVEVHRSYGRKGLSQYTFVKTECDKAATRIMQLAERIATDAIGSARIHRAAMEIIQLLGGK